ncbi:MAG TPA: hypothetical protein P5316_13955 [Phycisphaerae bacterium]|nr:hypothetical protein [Phycisphaerae bacterium]
MVELPGEALLSDWDDAPLLFETPVGALRPANDGIKVVGVWLDFDPAEGA